MKRDIPKTVTNPALMNGGICDIFTWKFTVERQAVTKLRKRTFVILINV